MNHPYVDDQPPDPDAPGVWGCRRRSTPYRRVVGRMTGELAELIAQKTSAREITHAAIATGFQSMADDACHRVLAGETSLDEIARVVDLTSRIA